MASIERIDTHFQGNRFCGVFVVRGKDTISIVEAGSTLSVPPTLEYLKEHNIRPEDVKQVFITHVHLDHSGGTGLLLQSLPNATVYTHTAGVQHIVNPHAKLVPGAVAVYGEEVFNQDYPGIVGTDASRVVGCVDGQVIGDF